MAEFDILKKDQEIFMREFLDELGEIAICAFCGKKIFNLRHPYHLDCFDAEIEKQFGMNAQFTMICIQDHNYIHNPKYCKVCRSDDWIERAIKNGAEEGERYIRRWKLFVGMCKQSWSDEKICAALLKFNSNCKPPEQNKIINYHIKYMLEHRIENG